MCGISGIIDPCQSSEALSNKAAAMARAIAYRGPDYQGVWCEQQQHMALSHRRLSIQDLSPNGNQPMHSHSGQSTIVFNGEIYNFHNIRRELEQHNIPLQSGSDTEILLEGIEHWGLEQILSKCRGMFAFALYDHTAKTLHLARDRIGEKPLYYGFIDNQFLFASELKAFFAVVSPRSLAIDINALSSYLRYSYISAPYSIFKDIKKLEPGHLLSIPLTEMTDSSTMHRFFSNLARPKQYWSLQQVRDEGLRQAINDESQAVDELDRLLNSVIKEQSISDVPLGTFLSGGIDSSVVAAILQANSSSPVDTFVIGFHERSFNEAEHAKKVAQHIGSHHHEMYVSSQDALNTIPSMPAIYDEPFANSAQIPTYLVSQMAKRNVTVCLSGDGGDEMFAGYNRSIKTEAMFNKTRSLPGPVRNLISKALSSIPPTYWDQAYSALIRLLNRPSAANVGSKMHKLGRMFQLDNLESVYRYLCSYWQDPAGLLIDAHDEPVLSCDVSFEQNFLQSSLLWDQTWYLPGDNLVRSDRASMACSLEMRLPLVDKDIIEFSWRVPNSMKVKDNTSKWLLRQVLYRYVPQSIIDRPKMGFSIPIAHWIRHDLRQWSTDLLSKSLIDNQGLFDSQLINSILTEHLSGKMDHSNKLWTVLMFQAWYQTYIKDWECKPA